MYEFWLCLAVSASSPNARLEDEWRVLRKRSSVTSPSSKRKKIEQAESMDLVLGRGGKVFGGIAINISRGRTQTQSDVSRTAPFRDLMPEGKIPRARDWAPCLLPYLMLLCCQKSW